MQRPIRIYLDTSDYAAFCAESPAKHLVEAKTYLLRQAADGVVEVGFSWPIISELIQDFDEDHRQDRVKRAQIVKEICGTSAFCYPIELQQGRIFSRDGYWFPDIRKTFNIRAFEKAWISQVASNRDLIPNRSERNALKNVTHRRRALRQFPQLVDLTRVDLGLIPLTKRFVNEQYLFKFMTGQISQADADRELLKIVSDPVLYITSWFDMAGKKNTFTEEMHAVSRAMRQKFEPVKRSMEEVRVSLKKVRQIERDLYRLSAPRELIAESKGVRATMARSLEVENAIKPEGEIWKTLGLYAYEVCIAYIKECLEPSGMKQRDSDFADILHAVYIPHCDLWRGDSAFANMLIKRRVSYADRIVPKLSDLPMRIEHLLRSEGNDKP